MSIRLAWKLFKKLIGVAKDKVPDIFVDFGKEAWKNRKRRQKFYDFCNKLGMTERQKSAALRFAFSEDSMRVLANKICGENGYKSRTLIEEYMNEQFVSAGDNPRDYKKLTNLFVEELIDWIEQNDNELYSQIYIAEFRKENEKLHDRSYKEIRRGNERTERGLEELLGLLKRDEVKDVESLRRRLGIGEEITETQKQKKNNIINRDWLYEIFRQQFESQEAPLLMMLLGKSSIGKTTFAQSMGSNGFPVVAYYAFDYTSKEKSSVNRCISEITCQLAKTIPEYLQCLIRAFGVKSFSEGEGKDRFNNLLVSPLCNVQQHEPVMIVIDALDEAKNGVDILAYINCYADRIPQWVHFFVTTRPKNEVWRMIKNSPHVFRVLISHKRVKEAERVNEDIRCYCKISLEDSLSHAGFDENDREEFYKRVATSAEGVFDYAIGTCKNVLADLKESKITDLSEVNYPLPTGVDGMFLNTFERLFPEDRDGAGTQYRKFWREPIGIIMATSRAIPSSALRTLMGWDENTLHDFVAPISDILDEDDYGNIQLYPLFLAEWLNKSKESGAYYSSRKDGIRNFALRSYELYKAGALGQDTFVKSVFPQALRAAGMNEQYEEIKKDYELIESLEHLYWELLVADEDESAMELGREVVDLLDGNADFLNGKLFLDVHITQLKAGICEKNGLWNEAAELSRQALEKTYQLNRVYDVNEASSAQSMFLAMRLIDVGRTVLEADEPGAEKEAETMYRDALRLLEQTIDEGDPMEDEIARARYVLAGILSEKTEIESLNEAEKLYRKALEDYERLAKDDENYGKDVARTYSNLALLLYKFDDREKEADEKYRKAIEIYRKYRDEDCSIRNELADSCCLLATHLGIEEDAESEGEIIELLREAISIYKEWTECDREKELFRANVTRDLAHHLSMISDKKVREEAIERYREALEIWNRYLTSDEDYKTVACVCREFADYLSDDEETVTEAEERYREALGLYEKIEEKDHDSLASIALIYISLAMLFESKEDSHSREEAEGNYRKAIAIYRQLNEESGECVTNIAATSYNLAKLLVKQEDTSMKAEAESLWRDAIALNREIRGEDSEYDLFAASVCESFAKYLSSIENEETWAEAVSLYKEAIEIYRKLKEEGGECITDIATTNYRLAKLLMKQEDTSMKAEAESLWRDAIALNREIRGEDSEYDLFAASVCESFAKYLSSIENEETWAEEVSLYKEAIEIYRKLQENEVGCDGYLARTCFELATLLSMQNNDSMRNEAEEYFIEAGSILSRLAKEKREYQFTAGVVLSKSANYLADSSNENRKSMVEEMFIEALGFLRESDKKDEFESNSWICTTCNNYGVYLFHKQESELLDEAITLLREALGIALMLVKTCCEYEPEVALEYYNLGKVLSEKKEVEAKREAETLCRKSLEIYERLIEKDSSYEKQATMVRDKLMEICDKPH